MEENLIYGVLFILIGMIGLLWARNAPKAKEDIMVGKVIQFVLGALSIIIGIVLLVKSLL
jgi:hypothetical protein